MFADMHKLMDCGHSSQNRKIVYDHFTRQLTGIGDDTIITDLTVMSDMGISHNQTIIPDFSNSLSSSAPINSHTFADSRIISDFYNGLFTSEFQILGYSSDHCSRKNFTILTDMGTFQNSYIRSDPRTFFYHHIFINRHKGFYHHIISNLSFRMNIC